MFVLILKLMHKLIEMKSSLHLKIRYILLFLLVSFYSVTYAQYSWEFNTNGQGWILSNNINGSIKNSNYELNITGSDPYMLSPSNLNIDAAVFATINIKMQNTTADGGFQIFWITNNDPIWNQTKSIVFAANKNDTKLSDYTIRLNDISAWSGIIKQIRFDIGNANTSGIVLLNKFAVDMKQDDFELKNEFIHIKQDLSRGGAISYISKANAYRNIVNIYDEGRYIQQSYYAGKSLNRQPEGQSPAWSPWSWNPIQGGDYARNRAPIIVSEKTEQSLYVKCTPMLWDMNNKPAEAVMEQWTTIDGNVIKVKNKLTCFRTDNIYDENILRDQEIPAVYPISALKNLYSYFGSAPWTNAALNNPDVVFLSSGFWGRYNSVTEKWMAFVDDNQWGIGVYSPTATKFLAGMAGSPGGESTSGSTSYISPIRQERLMKNSIMEYEYYLVVGSLTEIRQKIYDIKMSLNTSVVEHNKIDFLIGPNPTRDYLNFSNTSPLNVKLLSANSALIRSYNLYPSNAQIDVSGLQAGMYFLSLSNGNYNKLFRFVKL